MLGVPASSSYVGHVGKAKGDTFMLAVLPDVSVSGSHWS